MKLISNLNFISYIRNHKIKNFLGPVTQPQITDCGDGTYDVTYMVPQTEGANVNVSLNYGGQPVPGRSAFSFQPAHISLYFMGHIFTDQ